MKPDKLAEETLKEIYRNDKWEPNFKGIIKAMQEYHKSQLKDELIKFDKWYRNDYNIPYIGGDATSEDVVNEYLKTKP